MRALCRKLVGKLGRNRPSLLLRGDLRIWAVAVIYAIGGVNFLFDATQKPHLSADSISELKGVPKSTLRAKAKLICDLVGSDPWNRVLPPRAAPGQSARLADRGRRPDRGCPNEAAGDSGGSAAPGADCRPILERRS